MKCITNAHNIAQISFQQISKTKDETENIQQREERPNTMVIQIITVNVLGLFMEFLRTLGLRNGKLVIIKMIAEKGRR